MSDSSTELELLEPNPSNWLSAQKIPIYVPSARRRLSLKSLALACLLFLLTLITSLVAGTQFAVAYAHNESVSYDELVHSWTLVYRHPGALGEGLPFAFALLAILLAHELGHFFACRYHRIHATYPFFIPAPTLIGTFGAFILIRSPIRTRRALFDVGASGPLVGFLLAVPALIYGVLHAKVVSSAVDQSDVLFGVPLILQFFAALLRPGVSAAHLVLHPVGRAAWVGLFATSLNLLPAGQLDGGHILRSISARAHRYISILLPAVLLAIPLLAWRVATGGTVSHLLHTFGLTHPWYGWFVWAGLLFILRFLRPAPLYDSASLDVGRRLGAVFALIVFILCFMPTPILPR